jgi:hypothetical protein
MRITCSGWRILQSLLLDYIIGNDIDNSQFDIYTNILLDLGLVEVLLHHYHYLLHIEMSQH